MLKYAYKDGAKLQIMNRQNLTPLTLAAKLAKKTVLSKHAKEYCLSICRCSRRS